MILNKYINSNYERLVVFANNISHRHYLATDLLHDVLESVLQGDTTRFNDENDCEYYILRALYLAWNSDQSKFYRNELKYLRMRNDFSERVKTIEPYVADKLLSENIDQLIKRLPAFERMVFEEYIFDGFSYEKLAEATGIPKSYLYRTVKEVKHKLQSYGDFRKVFDL